MVHISTEPANHGRLGASRRSDRESNPDLIFRRDLFYPLNYQTIPGAKVMKVWRILCKNAKNVLFFTKEFFLWSVYGLKSTHPMPIKLR